MWHALALVTVAALAWVSAALGQTQPASQTRQTRPASDGTLVLDETAWQRSYVQFGMDRISPAQLKSEETTNLLGDSINLLKREVKRVYGCMGRKWDEAAESGGWMDWAYVLYRQGQAWNMYNMGRMNVLATTDPPPADWTAPDFDDGLWPRGRGSLMVGYPGAGWRDDLDELGRRAGYFRFPFEVPDLAKAGELELNLTYHGGARVFLNGRELIRKDLPEGRITGETRGTDYPLGAYVRLNEDGSLFTYARGSVKDYPWFLGDIYGSFDDAPGRVDPATKVVWKTGRLGAHGREFDRANWERIQNLRDRTSGPLRLPANLLRKGTNILAVEVRAADLHPIVGAYNVWRDPFVLSNYWHAAWFHAQVVKLELRCRGGSVPCMKNRPAGVQVWVEDMHHRVFSTDFANAAQGAGTLRFVAALNGEFAGQIVVGTDRELKTVKATPSELKTADGKLMIPSSAISVAYMVGHPVTEMVYLANSASGGRAPSHKCTAAEARDFLATWGSPELQARARSLSDAQALEEAGRLSFFDHISPAAPSAVPARSCQPIWLTLKVPATAKPGLYKGAVRVEVDGEKPLNVPVEAHVIGWRVPDRADWQMVTCLEQSPYGVAERYKTPLWSDEHFQRMETSFRELGRVGNKWLFVPVLQDTELGNRADSMLTWIRKKDASLGFDYAIMDRYIDLAVKEWGRPRVICFYVMHGGVAAKVSVPVRNEASGQVEAYEIATSPTSQQDWQAFGKALFDHMKTRGLHDVMYFGFAWDGESDAALPGVLGMVAPGVQWASGSHGYTLPLRYTAQSQIYGAAFTAKNLKGWKRSDVYVLNPRGGGTVLGLSGTSSPALFRILPGRALTAGCNGVGRMAADYWEGMYFLGCSAGQYLIPGMGLNSWLLWPGPQGAQPSQRFEAMREGIMECEARIFIEQALERGYLEPELAQKAQEVLTANEQELYFIPVSMSNAFACHFSGYQQRMARLFQTAAQVADAMGLDTNLSAVTATIPARGSSQVRLRLRNWSDKPRRWQAQADPAWIVPKTASGSLEGWGDLVVTLDGTKLEPLAKAKGTLTITDTATGKARTVSIAANVTTVLEFLPPNSDTARQFWNFQFLPDKGRVVYNVRPRAAAAQQAIVLNRSAAQIAWKAAASASWVRVEPAEGKVAPESPLTLTITATPPDAGHAMHNETVTLTEAGGPASVQLPLAVHVIPAYQKPALPAGQPAVLDEALTKSLLKSASGASGNAGGTGFGELKGTKDKRLQDQPFTRCFRGGVPYEAVFKIADQGFTGFSAHVGLAEMISGVVGLSLNPPPPSIRVYYEIYVDGQLRAQSDVLSPKDDFRLLSVENLSGAKELRLVVRPVSLPAEPLTAHWLDPTFYKAQ